MVWRTEAVVQDLGRWLNQDQGLIQAQIALVSEKKRLDPDYYTARHPGTD